jgi:hypothetical protein
MGLYLVQAASASPGSAQAGATCRCCPAGSRSTRARRYPSDMTDAEWAMIEPLLPAPGSATRRVHDALREQVRALAGRRPQPTAAIIDS